MGTLDSAPQGTIAIVGTAGIPACYGGFETLAENLATFHDEHELAHRLVVYCSGARPPGSPAKFRRAELRYVPFDANGASSIVYDAISLFSAARRGADVILLLGVSGAFAIPLIRLFFRSRVVTNIDGVEWRRPKWHRFARWWLRFSEAMAVRFSHTVIVDNEGIVQYVRERYGRTTVLIAYGGDQASEVQLQVALPGLPKEFALALCRIEPENNVAMILDAFSRAGAPHLVFVGNWDRSAFGRDLRTAYSGKAGFSLLDPIYDPATLKSVRERCFLYVHGHSAGGTNPSLVEMMHVGVPIIAYDCSYNRFTTENRAIYFRSAQELQKLVLKLDSRAAQAIGNRMQAIASARYTWRHVGEQYYRLLAAVLTVPPSSEA